MRESEVMGRGSDVFGVAVGLKLVTRNAFPSLCKILMFFNFPSYSILYNISIQYINYVGLLLLYVC